MGPLTAHPLPYQLELQLLPPTEKRFWADVESDEIFGYPIETVSVYAYRDVYWDTANADLHGSSALIRTRHFTTKDAGVSRQKFKSLAYEKIPFSIEYKATPCYMNQFFLSRKYGFARVTSKREFDDYLELRSPCEPLQMLYADRADLVGFPLSPDAQATVLVYLRRIRGKKSDVQVDIAFHEYTLQVGSTKIKAAHLIELQPNFVSGNNILRYLPHFRFVANEFVASEYEMSPVGKYQRIPRDLLDRIHNSRVYGVMSKPL